MKRLKFLIFFTIILLINTYRDSIFEKNELILNDKYEIQRVYMLGGNREKPEIILFGPEYSMIVKEENRIYQDTDYYYGKLEKIGKIGNYWVGRNFDHKDKLKDFNSNFVSFLYLMRNDEMKKNK